MVKEVFSIFYLFIYYLIHPKGKGGTKRRCFPENNYTHKWLAIPKLKKMLNNMSSACGGCHAVYLSIAIVHSE